jgi:hypothetical protein
LASEPAVLTFNDVPQYFKENSMINLKLPRIIFSFILANGLVRGHHASLAAKLHVKACEPLRRIMGRPRGCSKVPVGIATI